MKTKILKIVLFFLTWVFFWSAWRSLSQESLDIIFDWTESFLWFGLAFLFLILFVVLEKRFWVSWVLIFVSLMTSLVWSFSVGHFLLIVFGLGIASVGLFFIRKDFDLSLKIDLVKSLRFGKIFLVLAIVVVVSSQYFQEAQKDGNQKMIDNFELGNVLHDDFSKKAVSVFIPSFASLDENSTVDQSLLKNYEEQFGEIEQEEAFHELGKEKMLISGKKQMSDILGREVEGQEKMGKIVSEIANAKINEIFSLDFREKNAKALSGLLTGLLFLTIWPLGSILASILIFVAGVIFWIFKKTGLVEISEVTVQKEILV